MKFMSSISPVLWCKWTWILELTQVDKKTSNNAMNSSKTGYKMVNRLGVILAQSCQVLDYQAQDKPALKYKLPMSHLHYIHLSAAIKLSLHNKTT